MQCLTRGRGGELIVIPAKKTTPAESVEKVQDDFDDDTLQTQTIIKADVLRLSILLSHNSHKCFGIARCQNSRSREANEHAV